MINKDYYTDNKGIKLKIPKEQPLNNSDLFLYYEK